MRKEPPASERRRRARQRALLNGKFVFEHPAMTVDCTIRDLTDLGARVVVGPGVIVPRLGWLINVRDGAAHRCEVIWRAGGLIGVKFVETINVRRPMLGPLNHLHRLWMASAGR